MFCVIVKDGFGEVIEVYGPYKNTNLCMAKLDSIRSTIPYDWKFKIFNLYE